MNIPAKYFVSIIAIVILVTVGCFFLYQWTTEHKAKDLSVPAKRVKRHTTFNLTVEDIDGGTQGVNTSSIMPDYIVGRVIVIVVENRNASMNMKVLFHEDAAM